MSGAELLFVLQLREVVAGIRPVTAPAEPQFWSLYFQTSWR